MVQRPRHSTPHSPRLVPLIVASPMFLQNIDTTAMATALPSMARSLGVPALQLNWVITVYLLSLAVFLPLSAWLADRFGARRMFCIAIAVFSLASGVCGLASSLPLLVASRVLQGFGAALMMPVGRLILMRSMPPAQMLSVMVWYTLPPVLGRMAGPLVAGSIVSITTWHWIFFVNLPLGLLAIVLALKFVEPDTPQELKRSPFDGFGFGLLALGLAALLGALESATKAVWPPAFSALAAGVGLVALLLYGRRSRSQAHPVINLKLLRLPIFRAHVLGAAPLRMALHAVPFLLPLLLQLVFGLSPLKAGALVVGSALGALCTRAVMRPVVARLGFRPLLLAATTGAGLLYGSYAWFTAATPHWFIFATLFCVGLLTSAAMVGLNTLGLMDVPREQMSHATALTSMSTQLSSGLGVALAAGVLAAASWWHGGDGTQLQSADFAVTFCVVALLAWLSLPSFMRLPAQAGIGLR
jgi:EmrB/QacA subfamily drug resistance transporter